MIPNVQRARTLPEQDGEAGYMLLAVVVMCALVLLALSVAAAVVAKDLRRDKEIASQQYMQEYVRAIQLYYRKNNSYPPSMKALEQTNNIRYLRQKFVDPLTGKDDWRIIHQGEQKTTIKSFFGKELAGLPGGGGGLGSAAGMQSGAAGASAGGATTISAGGLAGGFNGATIGTTGSTGASGASGSTGSSGTGMFGDSTGGIIVGVGTSRTGNSITEPNGQTTYETWEFWYDPRIELLKAKVNILGGGVSSTSASGFGQSATGFGGATGSTGATGLNGTGTPFGGTAAPVGAGGQQQQQPQQ